MTQTPTAGVTETIPGSLERVAPRPWPPEQGQWTYEDWLQLPDDGFRYEILDGVLYMAPPPTTSHQTAAGNLCAALHVFVRAGQLGRVLPAPCGVRSGEFDIVEISTYPDHSGPGSHARQSGGVGVASAKFSDRL